MSRSAELGQQVMYNSISSAQVSVLPPDFPIEPEEVLQYDEENLLSLLRHLTKELETSLSQEELAQPSNKPSQEEIVSQLLHGLIVLWLAGSRYQLLKKKVDPFAELVRLYDQLSKTDGWLEPPHLGEAVLELLQKFQPKSLPPAPFIWKPSLSVGVSLCRGLNTLHRYSSLDPVMVYQVWLKLFEPAKAVPVPLPEATSPNSLKQPAKGYAQLNLWDETSAPIPDTGNNGLSEEESSIQAQATENISDPFLVTNLTSGEELVLAFERQVAEYQSENARLLEVKLTTHTTNSAVQFDMFGAAQLDMFGYVEQLAERSQIENNIPKRTLQHFHAAPDLDLVHRQAASLTLWFCALKAYAERVSIFHALPDWELI